MEKRAGGSGSVSTIAPLIGPVQGAPARMTPQQLLAGEPATLRIDLPERSGTEPEILSLWIRFPSGATRRADYAITDEERERGSKSVAGVLSGEPGEMYVTATTRYRDGTVDERSALLAVGTRNPVHLFVTPSFWTQSGTVGAPKYNFQERRWYCHASVRWVNSTDREVNLGRRVTVEMTDAGTHVGTFSFELTGDVVVQANSTVYGSLFTFHPEGSSAYNVFIKKGDLTFRYSMSGSGFAPSRTQIWRTMRVVGYNIIRVGDFTAAERGEYRRAAADIASGIFLSRDMTVHGVELYRIEGTPQMDADKARFRFIDNQGEIDELRSRYTVSGNWFLDVFFVEGRWDGAFGSSPVNGPVDKEGGNSGLVLRRDDDTVNLGQTFAHEAGHYLGLEHADEGDGCADTDPNAPNISDNFIYSSSRRDSTVITGCQIDKMRRHGLVRALTP